MSRGPKFCPTTKDRSSDFSGDSYKNQEKFFDSNWTDDSLIYTASKKYITSSNKELKDIIATISKLEPAKKTEPTNISKEEEQALKK